eukprot:SM000035S13090  [mRNA]  locus=s35:371070:374934:- [translate_table: standard]
MDEQASTPACRFSRWPCLLWELALSLALSLSLPIHITSFRLAHAYASVCLVTGGRGFVARHLVARLLEAGGWRSVRILDLEPGPLVLAPDEAGGPLAAALLSGRAAYLQGDVTQPAQVLRAVEGADVVFHTAGLHPHSGRFQDQYDVNVNGTRNVIDACRRAGVRKLVYTSTASIVFDGTHEIRDGDEGLPVPDKPMDAYCDTKAQAEALVLVANGPALATAALRPSGVFGPGDSVLLPTTVRNARGGKMKFIIGGGENIADYTYVENVAHAHLCAAAVLAPGQRSADEGVAAGKAYFITNGEPRKFWDFLYDLIIPLGYSGPVGKLPAQLILPIAQLNEFLAEAFHLPKSDFIPSRVRLATLSRCFNCGRAARLLGYAPPVPLEEGIRRTIAAFQHLRSDAPAQSSVTSKVHRALGSGKVADTLLWRDTLMSLSTFLALLAMFGVLFASNFTLVSLVATAALYISLSLFTYSRIRPLADVRLLDSLPDVSESWQLSEEAISRVALELRAFWNDHILVLGHRVAVEKDLTLFLELMSFLYVVKLVSLYFHVRTLVGLGLFGAFILPVLYEKHEAKVDNWVQQLKVMFFDLHQKVSHHIGKAKAVMVAKMPPHVRSTREVD